MKKKMLEKTMTLLVTVAVTATLLAGCGSGNDADISTPEETAADTAEASGDTDTSQSEALPEVSETGGTSEVPAAPYFVKGVYANYAEGAEDSAKTYFYVVSDETYGYTADGANGGIGLPFDMEQKDGTVKFWFGGAGESEDTLIVTAVEDDKVMGYFEDVADRPLIFELMEGEDPDTFSAENYVSGPEDSVYHDANGWSIRYDANRFEITPQGPQVFIVYTGESAGTNMITVTYTVDNDAEAAIKELGESWGDKTTYSEATFPGTSDVKGYWASLDPEEGGSGAYSTAVARDYMDGAIIFELTGHNGEDEEMNMEVSDYMAGIIDSLTWDE